MTVSIKAGKYVFKDSAGNVLLEAGEQEVDAIKGAGGAKGIKIKDIPNMKKQDIIKNIPDNWSYTENNGFVHIRDNNGKMRIRIDPADKVTEYPHVHIYDENGNLLDINGNIVNRKSPDGHIPYEN